MGANASLTERLQLFMRGDAAAANDLLREVMPKLREIALRQLRLERCVAPLTKTELINELWLSSLSKGGWQIRDQGHFYALASLAMRRVLIGLARKRLADRRGGGSATLSLDDLGPLLGASIWETERIVEIGILMDRLEVEDPVGARMVDMHYFSGFTLEEIAGETGLTLKQVRSRWQRGIRWLKRRLHSKRHDSPLLPRD
jgi:RNA polymerase sigma factor (TIGR02999 family)